MPTNTIITSFLTCLLWGCAHPKPVTFTAGQPPVTYTIHTIRDAWARCYLIETPTGLFLVDTGAKGNEARILKQMQLLQREDLKLIYLTHAHLDHYGCAAVLRQKTGALIAIHRDDATAACHGETRLYSVRSCGRLFKCMLPVAETIWKPPPTPADLWVEEGRGFADLGLPAVVLHLPGHTPGSTGLLLEGQYVFAGDLADTEVQSLYAENWDKVRESFLRLKAMDPELVFTGHSRHLMRGELDRMRLDRVPRQE